MDKSFPNTILKTSKKAGLSPGTLIHVGERKAEETSISIIDYDQDHFQEKTIASIEECLPFKDTSTVTWINIDGLHDVNIIEPLGDMFNIHSLVLEDVLHTGQRPKIEEHESFLFLVMKSLRFDERKDTYMEDQVSVIVGENYIITFQEHSSSLFNAIKARLRKQSGKQNIRKRGTDYLAYALMDLMVDHNFEILEILGEKLELLDNTLFEDISQDYLQSVYDLKKMIFSLRKSIWPMRDIVYTIMKEEYSLIDDSTVNYFRDVYDHVMQIIDSIEVYRELISSMIDTYLATLNMKMNQVMKVLTIAASIFMPLTFIGAIYGMNFKFMPELEWKWGYFAVLVTMISIVITMLYLFRKNKWI
ncbi:magnesium/cobalt transporter CorA [bacterium]|nr:magnesium/cobalt transporter CorA [bacterium]